MRNKFIFFQLNDQMEKNIGCLSISFKVTDDKIAAAVFFLKGSKTIVYFLILYFDKNFLLNLRYFMFVLIIGVSNIGSLILSKVF